MGLANNVYPEFRDGGLKWLSTEIQDGVTVYGNSWYVDAGVGSDSNVGNTPTTAFATIGAAINAAASNNDDVIFLSANTAHVQTSMLTVSKNRLHFVGTANVLVSPWELLRPLLTSSW